MPSTSARCAPALEPPADRAGSSDCGRRRRRFVAGGAEGELVQAGLADDDRAGACSRATIGASAWRAWPPRTESPGNADVDRPIDTGAKERAEIPAGGDLARRGLGFGERFVPADADERVQAAAGLDALEAAADEIDGADRAAADERRDFRDGAQVGRSTESCQFPTPQRPRLRARLIPRALRRGLAVAGLFSLATSGGGLPKTTPNPKTPNLPRTTRVLAVGRWEFLVNCKLRVYRPSSAACLGSRRLLRGSASAADRSTISSRARRQRASVSAAASVLKPRRSASATTAASQSSIFIGISHLSEQLSAFSLRAGSHPRALARFPPAPRGHPGCGCSDLVALRHARPGSGLRYDVAMPALQAHGAHVIGTAMRCFTGSSNRFHANLTESSTPKGPEVTPPPPSAK